MIFILSSYSSSLHDDRVTHKDYRVQKRNVKAGQYDYVGQMEHRGMIDMESVKEDVADKRGRGNFDED